MTTPETPREVAAKRLRERLRVNVGPNARMLAETGQALMLSPPEADEAVLIVLDALAAAGMVLTDFSRCSCRRTPADTEGPERDCPVHGEPEVMLAEVTAERDGFKADLDVTRGMLGAARRHADEAKAERDQLAAKHERDRLGFAIVEWDQGSGIAEVATSPHIHHTLDAACVELDHARTVTARGGRKDVHEIAEVIRLNEEDLNG